MSATQPPGQVHAYPTNNNNNNTTNEDGQCCGVVEAVVVAKERRRRKPQPWVVLKMVIPLVFGLMGYAAYAYVAQICFPMIAMTKPSLGGRPTGIVLLLIFSILYLWTVWAYIKVILTSPGYAKEFTQQSERPLIPPAPRDNDARPSISTSHEQIQSTESDFNHHRAQHKPSISVSTSSSHAAAHLCQQVEDDDAAAAAAAGPSYETQSRAEIGEAGYRSPASPKSANSPLASAGHAEVQGSTTTTTTSPVAVTPSNRPNERFAPTTTLQSSYVGRREYRERRRPSEGEKTKSERLSRKAPTTPLLTPVFRYCEVDKFVKPYRAHHCRICGTCVLKYDHHCPWIGGCVGARNHKFFINFCFVTSIFTAYVFATVLPFVVKATDPVEDGFDPRLILLLAFSGLFFMFAILLCINHLNLVAHGQTTVESMNIRAIRDRDDHVLSRAFQWWEVSAKRQKKKTWDEEWGDLNTEGNIWWRGNVYEEWVDVMGKNWLGWIFPIGRGLGDGTSYPVNPRFDAEGRMRRRSEWPVGLRR